MKISDADLKDIITRYFSFNLSVYKLGFSHIPIELEVGERYALSFSNFDAIDGVFIYWEMEHPKVQNLKMYVVHMEHNNAKVLLYPKSRTFFIHRNKYIFVD